MTLTYVTIIGRPCTGDNFNPEPIPSNGRTSVSFMRDLTPSNWILTYLEDGRKPDV
jgi:hypothetical protein